MSLVTFQSPVATAICICVYGIDLVPGFLLPDHYLTFTAVEHVLGANACTQRRHRTKTLQWRQADVAN